MSNEQRRQLIDVQQTYSALRPASTELDRMGTMSILTVKGRRYVYENHGKVRKSLGPATPELVKRKSDHDERRKALRARTVSIGKHLKTMSGVNKALGIGRMRSIVARIIRELDREELLGEHVIVAGTHALHAYETACGVFINPEHVATTDADLVWDGSHNLFLAAKGVRREGIMGILRRVDRSFITDFGFNATNSDGFIVDLICPEDTDPTTMNRHSDLEVTPMGGINWLLAAPKFEHVIVADDGLPVRVVVPDPRTFALHKLWVSKQESRQIIKRRRDVSHAALVAELIGKYMTSRFVAKDMPWLPQELRRLVAQLKTLTIE